MRKYEAMFILVPDLEEEVRNNIIEKFKGIIEQNGTVEKVDEWGVRRLAYEIKHYAEGYYVVINFQGESSVVNELDRISKITEQVIRHMIVKEDE
ncbi:MULTISPECIES: 30S ribosomal protein S6 [Caloranaerobacter]|uniref:Small ribosomal subunit protein bS6 n=2 Tax=Caloranaerobacter azorensis TaxID=116090 RepID=A0A1M5TMU5_9FIRM|nr:30S ribosomal protein S6 [Caloranaerobacter azorensis]QIB27900.1 30S ribosomal protein S6 [Caloranaerobacter azorensis]SHH52097.1 SSU ribosomal protein S6P [Caloranaerobacter azorensis DSM 13643]